MASPNKTAYTTQYMDNWSFDDTYKQNAVELLGEYSGTLKKLQTDEDGSLKTIQPQLESLIETLNELVQRLAPLAGAMNNTAQLRTVVTGAVTATGGGYITSAQHIANTLTQTNSLIAYNRSITDNLLATQANINNATA